MTVKPQTANETRLEPPLEWAVGHIENLVKIGLRLKDDLVGDEAFSLGRAIGYLEMRGRHVERN